MQQYSKLKQALVALDQFLTGKTDAAANQPADIELLITDSYYLSDCGYSRVAFNLQTGKLFLTHNSRQAVRLRWPDAAELVEQAELAAKEELAEWEAK